MTNATTPTYQPFVANNWVIFSFKRGAWSKLVGELGGLETLTTVTTENNLVSEFADEPSLNVHLFYDLDLTV